jgi:hypothetical protein
MLIMGIDPGGSTGICVLDTESQGFRYETLGPEEHHSKLEHLLNNVMPDVIVLERFDNRGIHGAKLISLEYVGVVKLVASFLTIQVELHSPSMKGWWTSNKLKQAELWVPGRVHIHEMDALRHVLYYMSFTVGDLRWVKRLVTGCDSEPAKESPSDS